MRREQATTPGNQNQLDATRLAIDAIEARLDRPLGLPTTLQCAGYQAQWGDMVRCSGTFTVTLPASDRKYLGQVVTIKNEGSGTITVLAVKGDTIDGAASQTIVAGDCYQYVCAEPGKWIEAGPRSSGGWVWAPTSDQATDYACSAMYELVQVDNSAGPITVTLPSIAGAADIGKMVAVKSVVDSIAGVITVNAASGQTMRSTTGSVQLNVAHKAIVFAVVSATAWVPIYDYEEDIVG